MLPAAPGPGRPPPRSRLIAGLLYLEYAFKLSDTEIVALWLENPYWQIFTGEIHLQTEPPIDPSSLFCWRKRLGEALEQAEILCDVKPEVAIVDRGCRGAAIDGVTIQLTRSTDAPRRSAPVTGD